MKTIHATRFHVCQTIMIAQGLSPGWSGVFGSPEETDFCARIAGFACGYTATPQKDGKQPPCLPHFCP